MTNTTVVPVFLSKGVYQPDPGNELDKVFNHISTNFGVKMARTIRDKIDGTCQFLDVSTYQ